MAVIEGIRVAPFVHQCPVHLRPCACNVWTFLRVQSQYLWLNDCYSFCLVLITVAVIKCLLYDFLISVVVSSHSFRVVKLKTCHIKTESIRKLSNFNFQGTKTLYQKNLNNIAFFLALFKGYNYLYVITPKNVSHGSPRKKKMLNFTRIVKTEVKFWKLHVKTFILWNLTFIFSGFHVKFSLVLLQITNYIYSPWNM